MERIWFVNDEMLCTYRKRVLVSRQQRVIVPKNVSVHKQR